MKLRTLLPVAIAACILPGLLFATTIGIGAIKSGSAETAAFVNPLISGAFAISLLVGMGVWVLVQRLLLRPLASLAREAQRLALTPTDRPITVTNGGAVGDIVGAVSGLGRALQEAVAATEARVTGATGQAEAQKRRLEAILLDLTEGVIVCNRDHRILLYNEAARRILGLREMTGLGRSLFGVLTREPVLHTLDILMRVDPAGPREARRFMVSTVDLGTLVETRMSLVREASGEHSGYVLSFQDAGPQLESLGTRDALLREVMVEWRRPIANLSAAIETFADARDLSPGERAGFEEILRKEIAYLSSRFNESARRFDRLDIGHWGTADVHSSDLVRAVEKSLEQDPGTRVRQVGLPMWINADSHALTIAIVHLVRRLAAETGVERVDLGVTRSGAHAYVDIGFEGSVVRTDVLDQWLDEPLKGAIASRSARQIIERHGGEAWSMEWEPDGAVVRIPLRPSERRAETAGTREAAANPPRPEYYDFDLFRGAPQSLADAPLREMRYVVFDTETTGLQASKGDEILSIGAVQVLNGRILTSETFERLIDPERDIPTLSTRFHGITPDMVEGKPPARIVLPQFRAYAGDAVLVAYNIAFDMKFLTKRQEEAGVVFDNPVLDALLLAIHVFPDLPDPSLSAMANYLEIEIEGRHTALGDAMMTAAVWVRLIEGLEKKGVTTFGQAVAISDRMLQERRLNEVF